MIFSKLTAQDPLTAYPKAIRQALDFIRSTDWKTIENGKYPIMGDDMFANVMDMTTRPLEGSHPEVHEKYIDLMYWPEGGEKIGVAPRLGTEPVFEARPDSDISFLASVENESVITATEGCFGVFFPWDAHRPGLFLGEGPAVSRKCVVKISVKLMDQ